MVDSPTLSNPATSTTTADNNISTPPATVTAKSKPARDLEIQPSHGVSEEDKLLVQRHDNAVGFSFDYSKRWCKSCKDIVMGLEKRAYSENEACRAISKVADALQSAFTSTYGAPLKTEVIQMTRFLKSHANDMEHNNTKRCRELLEMLTRQRNTFEKTRKFLKDKWKAEDKRMSDAKVALVKARSDYHQRCHIGVKLREELASAQYQYNDFQANVTSAPSNSCPYVGPTTGVSDSSQEASVDSLDPTTPTSTPASGASSSATNQLAKQKSKVERLEKQLMDNDKKEFELMYAYREAVETANHRLQALEKCRVEVICDTRLTVAKNDEIARDTLADFFNHLYTTRITMINQFNELSELFQNHVPCSNYKMAVDQQIQNRHDCFPEKFQFVSFHEVGSTSKLDASSSRTPGRLTSLNLRDEGEGGYDSDSESEPPESASSSTAVPQSATPSSTGSAGGGGLSKGTAMLSSLVQIGSNLFKPESLKKSVKGRRKRHTVRLTPTQPISDMESSMAAAAAALVEKQYGQACQQVARCIAAIEKQSNGIETKGIYRVPASKSKVASLMELLTASYPNNSGQLDDDLALLSQESSLTLAGAIKAQLISLPEPLFTYDLYPKFVELGKAIDACDDDNIPQEAIKRLHQLVESLPSQYRRLAGLLFHHLYRVSLCKEENQMGSVNLGTMFGPTFLKQRPMFQVANMMEFVDNKVQIKVVGVMIDHVSDIFGPSSKFQPHEFAMTVAESETRPKSDLQPSGGSSLELSSYAKAADASHLLSATTKTTPIRHHQPLLRSATMSSTPASGDGPLVPIDRRLASKPSPSAHLGTGLPVYTPYSDTQLGQKESLSSAWSTSQHSIKLIDKREGAGQGDTLAVDKLVHADEKTTPTPSMGSTTTITTDKSVDKSLATFTSRPPSLLTPSSTSPSLTTSNDQASPVSPTTPTSPIASVTCSPSGTSVLRGIKKLVHSAGHANSPIRLRGQSKSTSSSTTEAVTPAPSSQRITSDPGSAISVSSTPASGRLGVPTTIGGIKVTQSSSSAFQRVESKEDDDYSFIDTDSSESS